MKTKNVFLLVDVLQSSSGGTEKHILELSKNIDKKRYSLTVGCLSRKDKLLNELSNNGISVVTFNIRRIYDLFSIIQGLNFIRTVKKNKIEVLMTYHFGSDIWGVIFGKIAGVPIIISNRRDVGFWKKWYHNLAYKLINVFVNKIIVVSDAVKSSVIKTESVNPDKIIVVRNGIDLSRFGTAIDSNSVRQQLGISKNTLIVGCVGNFKNIKGQEYLIRALPEVRKKTPDFKCIFVGSEFEEEAQTIKNYGQVYDVNDQCLFLGKRDDVPNLLSVMDICVSPSLSEGFSNVLLEYMAVGKPIIATNVGGNPELITHKESGLLVPPADSHALSEAIITLLNNRELRQKLGQTARKKVEKLFSIEKMVKEYEDVFEDLTTKNKTQQCHLISSNGLFGAEKVMLSLASNMNDGDIKQYIVAVKNEHNPHDEVIKAAEKKNIPTFTIESKGRFDWRTINALSDFIRNNNIKVLYTHNYKANFLGLLAAKRTGIAIVAVLHGYIGGGRKLRLYEMFDRWILRFFDKVVLVDKSMKKYFKGLNGKITVINNGVRVAEKRDCFVGLRPPRNDVGKGLVIGTVGRLSEEKGHKYLLEAFSKLVKDNPNVRLLIVGDGELRETLEQLAGSLGIREKVEFTGFQEDIDKFYSLMDIYVSSSLVEHFPLSILEAMSFEKPIVATNAGGTSDLIKTDETGILVNPGSSEEIYHALLRYVQEPDLMKICSAAAHKLVKEKYSLEGMVDSYKEIYENIARNN